MNQKHFRRILLMLLLLIFAHEVLALPCARTTDQQDAWVRRSVDTLVRRAHAAYEQESAEKLYARSLRNIANTIKQCKFSENVDFTARYPTFFEYVRVLSLEQQPDHELGFEVSDEVYFDETKSSVAIPDFLVTTEFLQAVKHNETLPKAKSLLRALNVQRTPDDQLLFFSYESRHLGTPDNDFSYRRLLIVVPGKPAQNVPEKWVQFGITDPENASLCEIFL